MKEGHEVPAEFLQAAANPIPAYEGYDPQDIAVLAEQSRLVVADMWARGLTVFAFDRIKKLSGPVFRLSQRIYDENHLGAPMPPEIEALGNSVLQMGTRYGSYSDRSSKASFDWLKAAVIMGNDEIKGRALNELLRWFPSLLLREMDGGAVKNSSVDAFFHDPSFSLLVGRHLGDSFQYITSSQYTSLLSNFGFTPAEAIDIKNSQLAIKIADRKVVSDELERIYELYVLDPTAPVRLHRAFRVRNFSRFSTEQWMKQLESLTAPKRRASPKVQRILGIISTQDANDSFLSSSQTLEQACKASGTELAIYECGSLYEVARALIYNRRRMSGLPDQVVGLSHGLDGHTYVGGNKILSETLKDIPSASQLAAKGLVKPTTRFIFGSCEAAGPKNFAKTAHKVMGTPTVGSPDAAAVSFFSSRGARKVRPVFYKESDFGVRAASKSYAK